MDLVLPPAFRPQPAPNKAEILTIGIDDLLPEPEVSNAPRAVPPKSSVTTVPPPKPPSAKPREEAKKRKVRRAPPRREGGREKRLATIVMAVVLLLLLTGLVGTVRLVSILRSGSEAVGAVPVAGRTEDDAAPKREVEDTKEEPLEKGAFVVDEGLPPAPIPPPLPVFKSAGPPPPAPLSFKPTHWEAKPDPPAEPPPDFEPRFGVPLGGSPLLASLGGPFYIDAPTYYAVNELMPSSDGRMVPRPKPPVPVVDLRTGKHLKGEFNWRAPAWAGGFLSPDGTFVAGPDSTPESPATTKEGYLFVWKRGEKEAYGRIRFAVAVAWMDFVAADRLAVLSYDGATPVLRIWDLSRIDRKSTRLNSSHLGISYAVFCLK